MSNELILPERGYSPYVAGELEIAGNVLLLAALGPGRLVLQQPARLPPGRGILRTIIDRSVTTREIELIDGIDPERRDQPFRVIGVSGISAVA